MSTELTGVTGRGLQHLLLSLLGDYWYQRTEELPSTSLVRVLSDFDVTEANARARLSRLARRGLLRASRYGRRTAYALSNEGHAVLRTGTARIFSFAREPDRWDGHWTVVGFSVPEDDRSVRASLRGALREIGFVPLYDAMWIAPSDRQSVAGQMLRGLGVTSATVVVGKALGPNGEHPAADWNLAELQARYTQFIESFDPLICRLRSIARRPDEALRIRTSVMDTWRTFPDIDPGLADELLPASWPRARAYRVFARIYDQLGPPAADRVRELVAIDDAATASLVRHHTTTVLEQES